MKESPKYISKKFNVSVDGIPLEFETNLPTEPVKPQRMLPIFQQMANIFTDMGTYRAGLQGKEVSCKAGCGACCRQVVPISEAEAYQLAELVENMPEPRRSEIKRRFEEAHDHFSEIGWLGRLDNLHTKPKEEQVEAVQDYFREGIPCPFLEDESCSIHKDRPLACREYLVTSPATNCSEPSPENIEKVEIPTKPAPTLCAITRSKNAHPVINGIPMVLSLFWAERFKDELKEKSGEQWMEDFIENLPKVEK